MTQQDAKTLRLSTCLNDDALLAAWHHVQENDGVAGVDRVSVTTFGESVIARLQHLRNSVEDGTYHPKPLLGIRIPRPGKSPRELAVPSVPDRVLQTAVARSLSSVFESTFEDFSFGYRPGRSVPKAIIHLMAARENGKMWVAEADIQSCFDAIPWQPLLDRIAQVCDDRDLLDILARWLHAPVCWHGHDPEPRHRGIPQGSPLSPLLCNIYLDGLDKALLGNGWTPVRYADDFVIATESRDQAILALRAADQWLDTAGLSFNRSKTRIVHFDEGFDFLGVHFIGHEAWAVKPGGARWLLSHGTSQHPEETADKEPETGTPRLRTLYVTEPGTYLHISGRRLIATHQEQQLASVPLQKIDSVIIDAAGAISFTALRKLMRQGSIVVVTDHQSQQHGLFMTAGQQRSILKLAQLKFHNNHADRLAVARLLIGAKLRNSRIVLARYYRLRGGLPSLSRQRLERLEANARHAKTLDSLRGIEGSAAREYFARLADLLPSDWHFDQRSRHPPKDMINALLSYGYVILHQTMLQLIHAHGLDPGLAALHEVAEGHASLASDLMEPYRSLIVDATLLKMIVRDVISPGKFNEPNEAGQLPLVVRRRFIRELEAKLNSPVGRDQGNQLDWRRRIEADVIGFSRLLKGSTNDYQPWLAR